jgi:hypothetical protein
VNETSSNDTVPVTVFNRTGYKVKQLSPFAVPDSKDDGDSDFQEHITAMQTFIADGKAKGFAYPDLEARMGDEQNREHAYLRLMEATMEGNASFASKDNADEAISGLVTALKRADELGLELGTQTARALLKKLQGIQPAREELDLAIMQANVSLKTTERLGAAIIRLNAAIAKCEELQISQQMSEAYAIRDRLNLVKAVFVQMKAANVQAEIAMTREQGEEAAIKELTQAAEAARSAQLYRDLPVTLDLREELIHMNAEHEKVEEAMEPTQA